MIDSSLLRIGIFAIGILTSAGAVADDSGHDIKRPAHEVVLHLLDNKSETIHLADASYISQGVITLFPGDDILVEFDLIGGALQNPHVVKTNLHPERTTELKIEQDKDMTSVSRSSGFARKLTMKCYFLTLGSDFKNNANMFPLEKSLPCFDSFEPKTYCIKFYNFGLTD